VKHCVLYTDYEERNKDNVPEPYIPPPETKNRLVELLNEVDDDAGDGNTVDGQATNDEHTTSVVEAEVYAAVDHDADLPPPPPPDYDPAFDQVTTVVNNNGSMILRGLRTGRSRGDSDRRSGTTGPF